MFKTFLKVNHPYDTDAIISGRSIEDVRLNLLTPIDKNRLGRESFFTYFLMFAKCYSFIATMAHSLK